MGFLKEKRVILARGMKSIGSRLQRQTRMFPITSAQILAMFGAPVSLLAAPGVNKVNVFYMGWVEAARTATAYVGGGALTLQYHVTTSAIPHTGNVPATVLTTAGAGTTITQLDANGPLAVPINEGIDLTNLTAAFTAGTGLVYVTIDYATIDLM